MSLNDILQIERERVVRERVVLTTIYDRMKNRINNSVRVKSKECIYKIIPQFEDVHRYTEGLSPAKKMGLWGFINSDGSFIIKPQFDLVFVFRRGLAPVKIGGKWGYISR